MSDSSRRGSVRVSLQIAVAMLFLLVVVAGCKKDDNPVSTPPPGTRPTIQSFSADQTSLAAPDTVTFSWKVAGATSLSISGIGTVTPADSGSRRVYVSVTTTYTLTATNSVGEVAATVTVTVSPAITLNGFVKDMDGEPISGVAVIVKGKPAVTTSSGGSFMVTNVTVPYEVSLILSSQSTAVTYKGLTRPDPTLLYLSSLTAWKSATISGTVPGAVGKTTMVCFVSGIRTWATNANPTTGTYSISAQWRGSATTHSGTLYVLRWSLGANNLPSTYDALGQRSLTISASGTFPNNNFAAGDLTDPSEQSIGGTISRPSTDYQLTAKSIYLNFGYAYVFLAGESGGSLTDNFAYNVATVPGATYQVNASASQAASPSNRTVDYRDTGIPAGSTNVSINLMVAPQLNLPAHNGTNIDTTTSFVWSAGGGIGVYLLYCYPSAMGPTYYIFTQGTSTTIPNFSPQGLGLPSNASYHWYVTQFHPLSSMDAMATDSFIPFVNGNGGDVGSGSSEQFMFATRP